MYLSQFSPLRNRHRNATLEDSHRTVWRFFQLDPQAHRAFLFRPDAQRVWVLSNHRPLTQIDGWRTEMADFNPHFVRGQRVKFTVRINPIVSKAGHRYDLISHYKLEHPEWASHTTHERIVQQQGSQWLKSREHRFGFQVAEDRLKAGDYRIHRFQKWRKGRLQGPTLTLSTMDLTGEALVTDPGLFQQTLVQGIGKAKGYGCGLLLLRNLNEADV